MKKVLLRLCTFLVLVGLMVGMAIPVSADTVVFGEWGNLTWVLNQTTGHLTISGNDEMKSLSALLGDNTTSWVPYKKNIKTVTIEEGVLSIGSAAFIGCDNLTGIEIANSITTIEWEAFSGCKNLKEINIPNGVTSIEYFAFGDCTGLTSIEIPKSVTDLDSLTFSGCTSLDTITVEKDNPVYHSNGNCIIETKSKILIIGCKGSIIPSDGSVTSIGDQAFEECTSLTSIEIPNGITSIGECAFHGCTALARVEISNSVTSIEDSAFEECSSLTFIDIPDSITSIGEYAFGGCCSLTSIIIPHNVTFIGESAFEECSSLTNLTVVSGNSKYHSDGNCIIETENKTLILGCNGSVIPADGSVMSIGNRAFSYCDLTNIEIPNSVTSIGSYAFVGCSSLTKIEIPDSVISIGDGAFAYCTGLTHVKTPYSGTHIGRSAFSGCSSLISVIIPNDISTIEDSAFENCSNLTHVVIPNSVTSIGWSAFQNCKWLTQIIYIGTDAEWNLIEKGVNWNYNTGYYGITFQEDIVVNEECGNLTWELNLTTGHLIISGNGAMDDFDWMLPKNPWDEYRGLIKSAEIGEGITSIGEYAFYCCDALTEIKIPNSLTSIGSNAFSYCSNLTSFTISNTVIHLGSGIFVGCNKLTDLVVESGNSKYYSNSNCVIETESKTLVIGAKDGFIPTDGSVTAIGSDAFSGCDSFTSITIPDSITSIGDSAFGGCPLTEIVLPCNVIKIGDMAFSGCRELTNIVFQNAEITLGEEVFRECTSLHRVILPDGMKTIAVGMFHGCYGLISVEIPDSVTTIEASAFAGCYNMPCITIPDSVTTIGDYAFYDCHSSFYRVNIGSGVTNIGESAFACCSSLSSISYNGTEAEWNAIEKGEDWNEFTDYTMYFKDSSDVISGEWGKLTWTLTPFNGQLTISGDGAMDDFDYEIEDSAWYAYRDLVRTVTIEGGITSIGAYAFYECVCLSSVEIPDSVTSIGMGAFATCYSLTFIEIPDSVNRIDMGAFTGCCSLTSIKIPNGVIDIEDYAFAWCLNLHYIEIPNSVISIGEYVFDSCDSLVKIIYYGNETTWNNIAKDETWDTDMVGCTVYFHESCIWVDGEVTKEPTHTECGEKTYTCVCGETKIESIEKLPDHTYGDWRIVTEATEDAEGLKEKVCECGNKIAEVIPKLLKAESPTVETPEDTSKDDIPTPVVQEDEGMTTGEIVAISVGGAATAGIGGASIWWFAIKKKKFSDLGKFFKKTPKV